MRKPFTELGQRSVFPEASIGARTFPSHSQSNKCWLKALPYWLLFSDTKAKTSCQTKCFCSSVQASLNSD